MITQADVLMMLLFPLLGGIVTSYLFELYDEYKEMKK